MSEDALLALLAAGIGAVSSRPARVDDAIAAAERIRLGALAATGAKALGFEVDLDRYTSAARVRAAAISIAATEVSRRFTAAGVRHVFFKGAVVDALFYGGRGLRGTSDIDVLVDDLARAEAAIAELAVEAALEKKRPRLLSANTTRSVPAKVHGMSTMIDMQSRWLTPPLVDDTAGVLARSVASTLPHPAHEDYAAYIGANLVMDRFSGRLKLALDLARLFTVKSIEWNVVVDRARTWRVSGALWAAASFVVDRLGVPAPSGLLDALTPPWWRRPLLTSSMNGAPIPGALTRSLESDDARAGARHFARYVPARILDYLFDAP